MLEISLYANIGQNTSAEGSSGEDRRSFSLEIEEGDEDTNGKWHTGARTRRFGHESRYSLFQLRLAPTTTTTSTTPSSRSSVLDDMRAGTATPKLQLNFELTASLGLEFEVRPAPSLSSSSSSSSSFFVVVVVVVVDLRRRRRRRRRSSSSSIFVVVDDRRTVVEIDELMT